MKSKEFILNQTTIKTTFVRFLDSDISDANGNLILQYTSKDTILFSLL